MPLPLCSLRRFAYLLNTSTLFISFLLLFRTACTLQRSAKEGMYCMFHAKASRVQLSLLAFFWIQHFDWVFHSHGFLWLIQLIKHVPPCPPATPSTLRPSGTTWDVESCIRFWLWWILTNPGIHHWATLHCCFHKAPVWGAVQLSLFKIHCYSCECHAF